MGASMALAGLSFAGCRRPEKHLVPFTRGVITYHFADKDEIVGAVLESVVEEIDRVE